MHHLLIELLSDAIFYIFQFYLSYFLADKNRLSVSRLVKMLFSNLMHLAYIITLVCRNNKLLFFQSTNPLTAIHNLLITFNHNIKSTIKLNNLLLILFA